MQEDTVQEFNMQEVVEKFNELYAPLVEHSQRLADAITNNVDMPFWAYEGKTRQDVADFVTLFEYSDEASGQDTRYCPAVIGIPESVWESVPVINELRKELTDLLTSVDKQKRNLAKSVLNTVQLRRFNRKATARLFVELLEQPDSITYFWHNARKNKRITRDKAIKLVGDRIIHTNESEFRSKLMAEQAILYALAEDVELARVYSPAEHPRANITIKGEKLPVKTAKLPLFFPVVRGKGEMPRLRELTPEKPQQRLIRKDKQIEDTPIAPINQIYRYK